MKEEQINKIVTKQIEERNKKIFKDIGDILIFVLVCCSIFTAVLFGVYLLPQVISLSESLERVGMIFSLGILGWALLPIIYIINKFQKEENK